jgi:predicted negative regulator of RcsB-dependent stress response
MQTQIVITPEALITGILTVCAAIITISGAIAVLLKVWNSYKNPDRLRDQTLKLHEEYLANDKAKIAELEEGNRITMQALLALMQHAINGNDIQNLKDAKEDLEHFLITRK